MKESTYSVGQSCNYESIKVTQSDVEVNLLMIVYSATTTIFDFVPFVGGCDRALFGS